MAVMLTYDSNLRLLHRWAILSFVYFIIAGCMGAFLRLQLFSPVANINYKYFLHGHSHLAFLGWAFNALFVALLYAYLPAQVKRYLVLFGLLQVSVIGMLISFPLQGYAAISITFSTLHIFLSYAFAYQFFKDIRRETFIQEKHALSMSFIKWALFFMVLSSLGPFALAAVMAKGLASSPLYGLAIYFYLHFQYDGWFTFAVFGLFFWLLESNSITYNSVLGKYFLWMMISSCLPAYALSALWIHPPLWVYMVAALSAIVQVIALCILIGLFFPIRKNIRQLLNNQIFNLTTFAGIAFSIKNILQLLATIPAIADMAYRVRNFNIGYLHLIFLGFVTVFLIAWYAQQGFLHLNRKLAKVGVSLLMAGFVGSEACIFLQPLFFKYNWGAIPFYHPMLFIFSVLMPAGISLVVGASFKRNKTHNTAKKQLHINK